MSERFLVGDIRIPAGLIERYERWTNPESLLPGWLDVLPEAVARFQEKWKITFEPEIPETTITLVLLGHSPKLGPVVFKSLPEIEEFTSESRALELAGGPSVSRLFDRDLERCAMIAERIVPGTMLTSAEFTDEDAARVAADVALHMHEAAPDTTGLLPVRRYMRDLLEWDSQPHLIPDATIAHAQVLGKRLLATTTDERVLHGDLHHQNILRRADGSWALIDPKGLYGDPAYEIAAFLYNPGGVGDRDDFATLTSRRFDIFSEAWGIERRRLMEWGFVGAVLSAVWSSQGNEPLEWMHDTLRIASVIEGMLD